MRVLTFLLFAAGVAAASLTFSPDAAACGGCFHEPPSPSEPENTQVTGHRMIFSISPQQTTLWDQISYSGNPSSFAWVLPVKGDVEVGLSSDILFSTLSTNSTVTVTAPSLNCAPPPFCPSASSSSGFSSSSSSSGGTVIVVSQKVVGPYETVVLHSTDPSALATWLASHNYEIAADVLPIISAYVAEGFDFLALKLVPGADVTSMRPVRVTTPGAGASLPLRMVASGVGALTPITLWVMGEGRYQPTSFPWFTITADQLVWDWATQSSNYKELRQAGYDATQGKGWLMETANPVSTWTIESPLYAAVNVDPVTSGYADDMGMGATEALAADLQKLWGGINPTSLWMTRMRAELPRAALDTDLTIGASASQAWIERNLLAQKSINAPACPTYPPCSSSSTSSGSSGVGGAGGDGGSGGSSGCEVGSGDGSDRSLPVAVMIAGLAFAASRRRRG